MPYFAFPFVTIVRHPGVFGLDITLVSGPTLPLVSKPGTWPASPNA